MKQHYRLNKGKLVFLLTVFLLMMMAGGILVHAASGAESKARQKLYTAIEIKSGDTLWDIAGHYAPDEMTTTAYIREVMELNRLTGSSITSGQNLIIFYYE